MTCWMRSRVEMSRGRLPVTIEDYDEAMAHFYSAMADEQPEVAVETAIDTAIDHLNKGRVVPRKVDELAGAVARARNDGAVGRAIGSKGFK